MPGAGTALARRLASTSWTAAAPVAGAAVAFTVLFWVPITTLLRDWLFDPEASHGLLLGPLAVALAWRRGWSDSARARQAAGLLIPTVYRSLPS
jgi:hypothetical protein